MKNLIDILEDNGFNVHLSEYDNGAEIQIYTDGGVDMWFCVENFTKEEVIQAFNSFNIDAEIDIHRQSELYKKDFTITESVKDFTKFNNFLKKMQKLIKK